ncbi:MAG: DNA polymerase III subunit alpha, partial [Clostridia bacterium]|nr:DNA polymerase III subunit alpha [Clostridia bacterium]
SYVHEVMLCINTKTTMDDPNRFKFTGDQFYFKSYDEMLSLFPGEEKCLTNTLEVAEKCNYKFDYGNYKHPRFAPPTGQTPLEYIRDLVNDGIAKKYGKETKEIRDRVEYELGVIHGLGYIEYYLIVWDYIFQARAMGISVGPGRGSGAGSLVAYLIGITDIDPLKYDLYFERFLNTERVSAPDFDIDFEDCRRQEVIEYVKRKYGADSVAKIVTFGTMAAKNAIKDVGRVLRVPYADLDKITKSIPSKIVKNGVEIEIKRPNILQKVFGFYNDSKGVDYSVPELVNIYQNDPNIKQVIDIAAKLEDMPRQASTHACGVLIGSRALDDQMPLSRNGDDITTSYVGVELEHLGFLKMDFLGLRNLSDIKMCIEYVKENYNVDVTFDHLYADPKVYELISSGDTEAIFQIESAGFQAFLRQLKPTCLEDIVAAVSLYRPGPMDSIGKFVESKHNPEKVTFAHPLLEPILKQTYGCIVYQEQVMRIVQELAGYSLGQADIVRRMMGKKKVDEMEREEAVFINGRAESVDNHGKVIPAIPGCLKNGVPENVAKQIWSEMKDFAKYAFNKSHAAAYSVVTYQTAYLKCYYFAEFMTAILNNRITKMDEIKHYVNYVKSKKIEVLPPDINESGTHFTTKNNKIRFGLAAVKGIGTTVIDAIIEERKEKGKFTSLEDFCKRCTANINSRLVENLIYAGAFDCFGKNRRQLILVYEEIMEKATSMYKSSTANQFSIFEMFGEQANVIEVEYPQVVEFSLKEKLSHEKEVAGVYISGHPLNAFLDQMSALPHKSDMFVTVQDEEEGLEQVDNSNSDIKHDMPVKIGGIITQTKKLTTKNGAYMLIFTLEDLYGEIECVMFPKMYEKFNELAQVDNVVIISGKLQLREGRPASISVDNMVNLVEKEQPTIALEKPKQQYIGLIIPPEKEDDLEELYDILSFYPGDVKVVVKIQGKNKTLKYTVRNCRGLISEICSIISEENIKYFEV